MKYEASFYKYARLVGALPHPRKKSGPREIKIRILWIKYLIKRKPNNATNNILTMVERFFYYNHGQMYVLYLFIIFFTITQIQAHA